LSICGYCRRCRGGRGSFLGSFHNVAHLLDGGAQIPLMEQSRAADESIRAGMGAIQCRLEIHSAIHSDMVAEVSFAAPGAGLLD
jgi:hypothetical protein